MHEYHKVSYIIFKLKWKYNVMKVDTRITFVMVDPSNEQLVMFTLSIEEEEKILWACQKMRSKKCMYSWKKNGKSI